MSQLVSSPSSVDIRRGADRQTRIDWSCGIRSTLAYTSSGPITTTGFWSWKNHDHRAEMQGSRSAPQHGDRDLGAQRLAGPPGLGGSLGNDLSTSRADDRRPWIRHSERNDLVSLFESGEGRPLDLIQMWVVPDELEVDPGYEQLELDEADLQGRLAVVASGMPEHRDVSAIRIHNRFAALDVARLQPGQRGDPGLAGRGTVRGSRSYEPRKRAACSRQAMRRAPDRGWDTASGGGGAERGADLGDATPPSAPALTDEAGAGPVHH